MHKVIYTEHARQDLKKLDLKIGRKIVSKIYFWSMQKIRNAEIEKIPYMLVVGEKEFASQTVAVRDGAKGIYRKSLWNSIYMTTEAPCCLPISIDKTFINFIY